MSIYSSPHSQPTYHKRLTKVCPRLAGAVARQMYASCGNCSAQQCSGDNCCCCVLNTNQQRGSIRVGNPYKNQPRPTLINLNLSCSCIVQFALYWRKHCAQFRHLLHAVAGLYLHRMGYQINLISRTLQKVHSRHIFIYHVNNSKR